MNEIIVKENIKIENLIYKIRGKQVMIDREISAQNDTIKYFVVEKNKFL